jgi:hypothetical protein
VFNEQETGAPAGSGQQWRRRPGLSPARPTRGTERGGEGDLVEALTCDRETRRRPEDGRRRRRRPGRASRCGGAPVVARRREKAEEAQRFHANPRAASAWPGGRRRRRIGRRPARGGHRRRRATAAGRAQEAQGGAQRRRASARGPAAPAFYRRGPLGVRARTPRRRGRPASGPLAWHAMAAAPGLDGLRAGLVAGPERTGSGRSGVWAKMGFWAAVPQ